MKQFYTIKDLCALLGIKETCVGCYRKVQWGDNTGNSLDQLCQNPDCEYQYHRILNVGQLIPSDECECGKPQKEHWTHPYPATVCDFKPTLLTVRGIKLVDGLMCECGHPKKVHQYYTSAGSYEECMNPIGCSCVVFRPTQTVEITTED